jgi:hypothetical protein
VQSEPPEPVPTWQAHNVMCKTVNVSALDAFGCSSSGILPEPGLWTNFPKPERNVHQV